MCNKNGLVRVPSETVFIFALAWSILTLRLAGKPREFLHEGAELVRHGDVAGVDGMGGVVGFDPDQVVDHVPGGVGGGGICEGEDIGFVQ